MANPITITANIGAWLTSSYTPHDLLTALGKADTAKAIGQMSFTHHDMSRSGWTRVGSADITITLMPQDDLFAAAVENLKAQLHKERADSQQRQNYLLDQISKLQALTFDGEVDDSATAGVRHRSAA